MRILTGKYSTTAFPFIFLLCLLIPGNMNAQEHIQNNPGMKGIGKNSVYLEILGNGAVYSINFDRIIPIKNRLAMILRLGGNEYHGKNTDEYSYNFICSGGILHGGPHRFFETGLGYTSFSGSPDRLIVIEAGYCYQGKKGFLFRFTPMYIINSEKGDTFGNCPWLGFSFGFSF